MYKIQFVVAASTASLWCRVATHALAKYITNHAENYTL